MKGTQTNQLSSTKFFKHLPANFQFRGGPIEQRILTEYGAVLVARGGAIPPETTVFTDEEEVTQFQERVGYIKEEIGGFSLELQKPAMGSLLDAIEKANTMGLSLSPRGKDSARRTYRDTEVLWASRVEPALYHWVKEQRLRPEEARSIRDLSVIEQVSRIFELEEQGLWFAKDLSKSIVYSVAPPGTSQHLSMLAFDVAEFQNIDVRSILAESGWFQTVVSDLPHFTFLGVVEPELPSLGLKRIIQREQTFWVPDI